MKSPPNRVNVKNIYIKSELKETINLFIASLVLKKIELQVQRNVKTLTFLICINSTNVKTLTFLCLHSINVKTMTFLGIKPYFSVVSF